MILCASLLVAITLYLSQCTRLQNGAAVLSSSAPSVFFSLFFSLSLASWLPRFYRTRAGAGGRFSLFTAPTRRGEPDFLPALTESGCAFTPFCAGFRGTANTLSLLLLAVAVTAEGEARLCAVCARGTIGVPVAGGTTPGEKRAGSATVAGAGAGKEGFVKEEEASVAGREEEEEEEGREGGRGAAGSMSAGSLGRLCACACACV